ncbi:matrixin family metalloprotease [Pseudomonas gessardii]|uniref:Matrixin family metalloprotease n=1 Tax=Pseudomonas gessardii TaxID=78544 RepID=A0ABS9FAK9_9PSED|nr:M10 family metallopeptidase C-terminal domain-containing protein [Pseudomonas gessardii]MCF4978223.1 matrixin family metalloprotease [Pseudomonas gessardii]MCF4993415.1 matrixin family metalloprotease [Pseudomonas gessardii]MCF5084105.1 matrixin family metalloprotease [Pseudomonas gessardii]MCF5095484.1 matrixin family metalloprotease [Pseudomonas gessardii]MCF5108573.1 matrixin family metalloprotease [Pseudomonas gessardii]
MSTSAMQGSPLFRTIDQFRHRDDRGGGIQHNGLPSKTTEEAAQSLWRASSGWPDKNGDGIRQVSYTFRPAPADPKAVWQKMTGFTHILENQRQQIRRSLESIADVANVTFSEGPKTANSDGHITLGNYGQMIGSNGKPQSGYSFAVLPGSSRGGEVWFLSTDDDQYMVNATLGDAGRHTIIHELGHAMGLRHPGHYDASAPHAQFDFHEDSQSHTNMSYRGERTGYMRHDGFRSSAPQLDDITAYQRQYGANFKTRNDDTTYGFNSNTNRDFLSIKSHGDKMVAAIWDGGGTDTLDFSGYGQDQKISLGAGTFSDVGGLKGNVAITYGVTIENAIGGSGNDWLVGNAADNELHGGDGDDVFYGAEGADSLWGGEGNDIFVYGKTNESSAAASDRIHDFVSGQDQVDVSGLRAQLGDKPLQFVRRFSGASGEAIVDYDPLLNMSTLQISGNPNEPTFLLQVQGQLRRSDIMS